MPSLTRFKHLQLISTQGRLVLMILVYYGGQVKQQMLTLAEPVPQLRLTAVAERLNRLFDRAIFEEVEGRARQLDDTLEREVARLVLDNMLRLDQRGISDVYRDGLSNIIEDRGARQAVRVLEEGTYLADVLSESLETTSSGVQVVIGGEGRWEELKDCTMILARYGTIEDLSGAVAVLGPTRMRYGRNISAVRYVADLMSGFIGEYYTEGEGPEAADEFETDEVDV